MFKRRRIGSISDLEVKEMMDVEASHSPDVIKGTTEPQSSGILQFVEKSYQSHLNKPVEFAVPCVDPLGIFPLRQHTKLIGNELEELTRAIVQADDHSKYQISNKLGVTTEQINSLREQERRALTEGQESLTLTHMSCNFRKVPGNTYFLYQRPSTQLYFSMLSPKDWEGSPPHTYHGAYMYGHDLSWTKVNEILFQ